MNGGFAPGELVYLGARPGVGKTALALDMARHASEVGQVVVVSREMLNEALATRMLAQESGVGASALKTKRLTTSDFSRVSVAATGLADRKLWLADQAVSIDEIVRLVGTKPPSTWSLVIVDYLQLVRAPRDIKDRRLQVEAVSQRLKSTALHYETPVLCLSSLSRADANGEPTLASLRESGELEHDADVVLLLHRPSDLSDEVICRIAKNRSGALGKVSLRFHPSCVTFR